MNKPILIAKKLDIVNLMDALNELYQTGVNYVDISGDEGEVQDSLYLSFCKSYMDPESQDNFDDIETYMPEGIKINSQLSDEDLNQIL